MIAIGWDKTIRLYDLRANLLNAVLQANLHGKPCCMDLVKDTLVVADSAKRVGSTALRSIFTICLLG